MTQFYTYRSPTTPGGTGWSVDLGNSVVRMGTLSIAQGAEQGEAAISSVALDDPSATVGNVSDAIVGLKQFDWTETDAPVGHRRIWTGYIGDRRYARDNARSLNTGVARGIDATLVDINTFLSFRVFKTVAIDATSSFNRSAETDVARVTALLGVDFLSSTLYNGLISTAAPVAMDAVDYAGQRPLDVLSDCAQQSGKNFFVAYDEAGTYTTAGRFILFYDYNVSAVYSSTLQISNVRADVDNTTTFYPSVDAVLVRDPSRVISGVYMPYDGGTVYRSLITTSYTYGYRDAVAPSVNVKTAAKANARADRYLVENSTEDDRITFSVFLPSANVNDWMAGQRAQVKFQHLPGYESFTWVRALRRTVMQREETDKFYTVEYEVTPLPSVPLASCSTALGAVIIASATGDNNTSGGGTVGTVVATTVSVTPTAAVPAMLLSYIATVAGDAPTDYLMTTPTGYTLLDSLNSTTGQAPELSSGISTWTPRVLSYKAVASPSGAYAAVNQYAKGYGTSEWLNAQFALHTSATSPVQHSDTVTAGGATLTAYLSSAPTVGNMIFAFVTVPGTTYSAAQSGWTALGSYHISQPYSDPADGSRNRTVNVLARCYVAGEGAASDGTSWAFGYGGGGSGYSIFLSEWVVS